MDFRALITKTRRSLDANSSECIDLLQKLHQDLSSCTIVEKESDFHRAVLDFSNYLIKSMSNKALSWFINMPIEKREEVIDIYFSPSADLIPFSNIFIILMKSLQNNEKVDNYVLHLLYKVSSETALQTIIREMANSSKNNSIMNELIQSLISFPDKVLSNFSKDASQEVFPLQFYNRLIKVIFSEMKLCIMNDREDGEGSTNKRIVKFKGWSSKMISKLILIGQSQLVAIHWIDTICCSSPFLHHVDFYQSLFTSINFQAHEGLLSALIERLSSILNEDLESNDSKEKILTFSKVFLPKNIQDKRTTNEAGEIEEEEGEISQIDQASFLFILNNKLIMKKGWKKKTLSVVVKILSFQESNKENILKPITSTSLLTASLRKVASVWSDAKWMRNATTSVSKSVKVFICLLLDHASKEDVLHSSILSIIFTGIQERLGCDIDSMRRDGMHVAKKISIIIDPSKPLTFKEDEGKEEEEDIEEDNDDDDNEEKLNKKANIGEKVLIEMKDAKVELDSDDDSDLEAINITKDGEEIIKGKAVRGPVYLKTLINGLRNNEDHELRKKALLASTALINSAPHDLHEIEVELTQAILHTNTSVYKVSYSDEALTSLSAVIVHGTIGVPVYLIQQLYSSNYNMGSRSFILEALSRAAIDLSNRDNTKDRTEVGVGKPLIEEHLKKEAFHDKNIPFSSEVYVLKNEKSEKQVGKVTKVFSKSKAMRTAQNKFVKVVSYFFYPLLDGIEKVHEGINILGRDFSLLTQIINTLSTFIECAGYSIQSPKMSIALLSLFSIIKNHPQVTVRRSIMYGLSRIALALPASLIVENMRDEMFEMADWIQDIVTKDGDDICRMQALALQKISFLAPNK